MASSKETLSDTHPGKRGESPQRSFGRTRGRKLSARRASLLLSGLERLRVDLSQPPPKAGLVSMFTGPVQEVWLEIGFGAGEHLIWQAGRNCHAGIIGAEPYINGVAAALSGLEAQQLQGRVRLHAGDVHPLLDWLPPMSVSRAFMLFPDPWPKKRHRARRLFAPPLLGKMARVLRPGAEFRFASDIADYAEAAVEHAKSHCDFELAQTFTSADRGALPDWPVTRYETKAVQDGRSSTFLVLRRATNLGDSALPKL